MKPGSLRISLYSRRVFSLAVLGVFLLLGFCPLRNTLCRLAQPEPARKTHPAPDYAKITSAKECVAYIVVAQQAAQPALSPTNVFNFTNTANTIFIAVPQTASVAYFSTIPLYLRNRALRI